MSSASPLELILNDHEQIKALFAEFHRADGEAQQELLTQISDLLIVHTMMEAQAFYPHLRDENPDLVEHAIQEHDDIDKLLVLLAGLTHKSPEFPELMGKLEQAVEEHLMDEEDQLLPAAEEELEDEFESIAQKMVEVRDSIDPTEEREELILKYQDE